MGISFNTNNGRFRIDRAIQQGDTASICKHIQKGGSLSEVCKTAFKLFSYTSSPEQLSNLKNFVNVAIDAKREYYQSKRFGKIFRLFNRSIRNANNLVQTIDSRLQTIDTNKARDVAQSSPSKPDETEMVARPTLQGNFDMTSQETRGLCLAALSQIEEEQLLAFDSELHEFKAVASDKPLREGYTEFTKADFISLVSTIRKSEVIEDPSLLTTLQKLGSTMGVSDRESQILRKLEFVRLFEAYITPDVQKQISQGEYVPVGENHVASYSGSLERFDVNHLVFSDLQNKTKIGEGAEGVVSKVLTVWNDASHLALKESLPGEASQEELRIENQYLQRVRGHPSIVPPPIEVTVTTEAGHQVGLLSRLEQGNAEEHLPRGFDAVRGFYDIASAVRHCHVRGITHRDIKLENLLVRDGRILLTDFGRGLELSESPDKKKEFITDDCVRVASAMQHLADKTNSPHLKMIAGNFKAQALEAKKAIRTKTTPVSEVQAPDLGKLMKDLCESHPPLKQEVSDQLQQAFDELQCALDLPPNQCSSEQLARAYVHLDVAISDAETVGVEVGAEAKELQENMAPPE